ncbi:MAG TPA: hypothetical protein VG826_19970 [Pirellulales bacterium]|nr:hypothetical protein [Pirellulales bacterium]
MKRLLVRTTALTGLLVVAALGVALIYRAQPEAMAQERAVGQPGTKKKAKPKSPASKSSARKTPAASDADTATSRGDRYTDRYADRYADPAPADTLDRPAPAGRRPGSADFTDEVPEAGPDLFPEAGRAAASTPGVAGAEDPFTNSIADSDTPYDASQAVGQVGVSEQPAVTERRAEIERPTRYAAVEEAGGRRSQANDVLPSQKKTASEGTRKKRALSAPVREVGAEQPRERATDPRQAGRSTPHRDPFGDAAGETAPKRGRQPMMGHGRPGNRQLEGAQSPTLIVEKAAPEEVQVGKPAVFAVRVQNVGTVLAQAVEIHDVIPQGTHLIDARPAATEIVDGQVKWTVGSIKPGEEATVEMELMPLAEGEIGSVATVHFAGEASVRTRATRPQLAIEVSAPHEVLIGEQAIFSIRISNPGTGVATGIVISENIPEQLEHPAGSELEYEVGDLKPGESRQIELTMNSVKAGQVVNRLMARGDGQLQAEQQSEFMVVAPQLELSMQGPKRRYLERQATYTVTVSNPGTAPAKEVQLLTHLPKGMKFVGANNSGQYDAVTNTVHWVLEELPAKQSGQVTLTALPVEAGEQTLKVEGMAERGLSAEQEEVVTVEGVAAILFQLADEADPIEVGGETTYEIKVVNQGSKAATNVQLVAIFPPQLKPRTAHGPTRDSVVGQEVRFQPLGRLAPKAETTYQIRAQGLEPGDLRVQVQLLTDEMQSPVTKEESTRVYADE